MTHVNSLKQIVRKLMPRSCIDLFHYLKYRGERLANTHIYNEVLMGKQGIEVGGPSLAFKIVLPIYPLVSVLDGVNFSNETMWEGVLEGGNTYNYYKGRLGKQFITDATDLKVIKSNTYDFLISSNCLEHVANPLKALDEWVRVIKPEGYLLLVLPKKESNFDRKRPYTDFKHILTDYEGNIAEDDLTHLDEILLYHDLSRDIAAGNLAQFKQRSLSNLSNRGLHHHVFDQTLIEAIFSHYRIDMIQFDENRYDYFALGRLGKKL
ncbi:MAG: methyltransferase domain-containing protein [bacterium]